PTLLGTLASQAKPLATLTAEAAEEDKKRAEERAKTVTGVALKEDEDEGGKPQLAFGEANDEGDKRFKHKQTETGEEEETTVFSSRVKLFYFKKGEWKERGAGVLKVNVSPPEIDDEEEEEEEEEGKEDGKKDNDGKDSKKRARARARIVMRADGVMRVILNTPLFKGMKFGDAAGNMPTTKAVNLTAVEEGHPVLFTLRVHNPDIAKELYKTVQEVLRQFQPASQPASPEEHMLPAIRCTQDLRLCLQATSATMLLIGLTGSIATGKSTVSSLLSSPPYSLPIIDADVLARKVVEPGTPGYKAIVEYFGPSTPDLLYADETQNQYTPGRGKAIKRPVLGRRVFGDEPERRKDRAVLNGIVHPAVRKEIYHSLLHYYLRGHWAVVLDIPLLFEAGIDLICGTVIVVGVRDRAIQLERLRARDPHLSAEDAQNRVNSQGNIHEKTRRAEFRGTDNARGVVVWNDTDKAHLEEEVQKAVRAVQRSSPRWWAWVLLAFPPLAAGVAGWNFVMNYWNRKDWEKTLEQERAKL
ncbi:hypothetical protein KEM56_003456, partial [Ascosphaera pollenicola]